jgi:hypothetical protein
VNTKNKNADLTIIVNEGKEDIGDATVRIDWKLSPALCALKPEYVVVVVIDDYSDQSVMQGRRYAAKVSDGHMYLQFYTNGDHKVYVMVPNPIQKPKAMLDEFLKVEGVVGHGNFKYTLAFYPDALTKRIETLSTSTFTEGKNILASAKVELSIPDGVFADPEKRSFLVRYVNQTANFAIKESHLPKNECDQRRQTLLSFVSMKFILVFALRIILLVFTLLQMIWLVVARSFVFFIGYRPHLLWDGFLELFEKQVLDIDLDPDFFMQKYTEAFNYRKWEGDSHRVYWFKGEFDRQVWKKDHALGLTKRMPASLFTLVLLLECVGVLYLSTKGKASGEAIGLFLALAFYLGAKVSNIMFRIIKPISRYNNREFWNGEKIPNPSDSKKTGKATYLQIMFGFVGMTVYSFFVFPAPVVALVAIGSIDILACSVGIALTAEKLDQMSDQQKAALYGNLKEFLRRYKVAMTLVVLMVIVGLNGVYFATKNTLLSHENFFLRAIIGLIGFGCSVFIIWALKPIVSSALHRKGGKMPVSEQEAKEYQQKIETYLKKGPDAVLALLPPDSHPCTENCEQRTTGDKIRLRFLDLKAKYCRPFKL